MTDVQLVPFYFPQFHAIPENDTWWGKGYTDWKRVKEARPLFEAHYQPRVPLEQNYYDLSSYEAIDWQIKLAQQYGLSGFCFYHYWFDGKLLLEKPMELFYNLKHDFRYCIAWANETWTKRWIGKHEVLIRQEHKADKKIWEEHFHYLLKFFLDERSFKINGKPVFLIYRPEIISDVKRLTEHFQTLALKNGLSGLYFIGIKSYNTLDETLYSSFDAVLKFQPRQLLNEVFFIRNGFSRKAEAILRSLPERFQLPVSNLKYRLEKYQVFDYDTFWNKIIEQAEQDCNAAMPVYHTALVDWDNTARYGKKAKLFEGSTPAKFGRYLEQLIAIEKQKQHPIVFINAWNEWSEGAYMEPDQKHGHAYLQILQQLRY